MKTFKHSGAFGDLIYSLPIVKYFGGGDFYLHLNQIDWIGQHFYGSKPNLYHQGRLTEQDYEFMKDFMLQQAYIHKFEIMQSNTEISHNLDRFRVPFVGHPGNYVDIYAAVFNLHDSAVKTSLRNSSWLTVDNPRKFGNHTVVINRTQRWIPNKLSAQWQHWREQGYEQKSLFVGLEQEYHEFKKATGWDIPGYSATSMLDLAEIIAGAEEFIGNQSVALSLAIGLGKKFHCEARQDLTILRNECYFPDHPNSHYF